MADLLRRRRVSVVAIVCTSLSCCTSSSHAPNPSPSALPSAPATPLQVSAVPFDGVQAIAIDASDRVLYVGAGVRPAPVAIVDERTGETMAEDSFGYEHTGVVLAFDSLWVANGNGACWAYSCGLGGDEPPQHPRFPNEDSLSRLDPTTLRLIVPIRLHAAPESIAANDEAVFVTAYGVPSTVVLRIDPATNEIVRRMPIRSPDPGPLAVIDGAVWMLKRSHGDWMIVRVDRRSDRIALPRLAPPVSFSSDGSLLWISSWNGAIIAIDPLTAATVHSIDTSEPIIDVSNGDGGGWAITAHRVLQIDLPSDTVSKSIRVARPELRMIDQAGGHVWIASTSGLFTWPQR
jgi:hypothetical protein